MGQAFFERTIRVVRLTVRPSKSLKSGEKKIAQHRACLHRRWSPCSPESYQPSAGWQWSCRFRGYGGWPKSLGTNGPRNSWSLVKQAWNFGVNIGEVFLNHGFETSAGSARKWACYVSSQPLFWRHLCRKFKPDSKVAFGFGASGLFAVWNEVFKKH